MIAADVVPSSSAAGLEALFAELGGAFLTPASVLARRLEDVRALVFDWDGVFNSGVKGGDAPSTFSEADAMGTNLLRYALWRAHGELPVAAIISGEHNAGARAFAEREHFHALYQGVKNKGQAVRELCAAHQLRLENILCVFDDVNDLAMARDCAVRVLVRREASPLLREHVARQALADYVTAFTAGGNAVRETAELLLGLLGAFETVVSSRVAFDADYQRYFAARQAVGTELPAGGVP